MKFDFAVSPLHEARVAIVGLPLDRSSSFIPGTRFGPDAARIGSANIESFSPYLKRDAAELAICDDGNVGLSFATPQTPLDEIRGAVGGHYDAGRKLISVGGEHTVTPAVISELAGRYPDLCVIQFDAHSDLRGDFLGEKWAHATAIARTLDYVPRANVFQLGIRSFWRGEEMEQAGVFPFDVLAPMPTVCAEIGTRPIYVTLDVDVLDPSVLPDVQTPQPGGVGYRELVSALAELSGRNVIGADVVEFCPRGPHPSAGAPLVAELVRELAIILGQQAKCEA